MTNELTTVTAKLASASTRVFQNKPVHRLEFVTADGTMYVKILNDKPELGWQKVFKALGMRETFVPMKFPVGHQVELVLDNGHIKYVNSLSPEQMWLHSDPLPDNYYWTGEALLAFEDPAKEKTFLDKVKEFLGL